MRSAIFIDGGYLLNQLADANVTPDYRRLADHLLAPLRRQTTIDLMRCYFYWCPPWMSEKPTEGELRRMAAHEKFASELEANNRWQLRLGKLERRRDGGKEVFAQKRVDVQLSVDLVHHAAAGHIQHAILIAGDSDFIPAVVAAKESGATVTLWCDQDKSVHKDLLAEVDEVHFIDWQAFPQIAAGSEAPAPRVARTREPSRPRNQPRPVAESQVAPVDGVTVSEPLPPVVHQRSRSSGGNRSTGGNRAAGVNPTQPAAAEVNGNQRPAAAAPTNEHPSEANGNVRDSGRGRGSQPRTPRPPAAPRTAAQPSTAQPPAPANADATAEAAAEGPGTEDKKPGRRRRRGGRGRRGKGTGSAPTGS